MVIRTTAAIAAVIALVGNCAVSAGASTILAEVQHASIAALATDRAGNIYGVGTSGSNQFHTTPDAIKRVCSIAGDCYSDAVVVRLSADGALTYATYLGGSSNETAQAVAVDRAGNIYVGGTTWSADFPVTRAIVTPRPAQQGFVMKISSDGRVVFSTTVGGEGVTGIAIDQEGAIYVTGFAYSPTVPMVNAIQPVIRSAPDAFVAKLSADGSSIVFSTFLGGEGPDTSQAIAVDPSGRVAITGSTGSLDFPVVRAAQSQYGGGARDGFVALLSSSGTLWEFTTLLGGRGDDSGWAVAFGNEGDVYVSGATESPDFPVTEGVLDSTCGSDAACDPHVVVFRGVAATLRYFDGFVSAFRERGDWRFSTFLGGDSSDEARAMALAPSGAVLVAGFSTSPQFARSGRLTCDTSLTCPPFVVRIDAAGSVLLASDRMPLSASYAPSFDFVGMVLAPDGSVLVASSNQGLTTIARALQAKREPTQRRRLDR